MSFITTSYFTLATPYQEVAHRYLMPSVQRLGLRSDLRGVLSQGSWSANTSYKPVFIKHMLGHHSENVVFLDCDAEILVYPDLFDQVPPQYIIAAHRLDREAWYQREYPEKTELLSGTLFIRNCLESHRLIDHWVNLCKQFPKIWEQVLLQRTLTELEIELWELPLSYFYIKTLPCGSEPHIKIENPVIVHNQVSRTLKHRIR